MQLGVVGDEDGPEEAPDDGQTSVDVEDGLPAQISGDDSGRRDRDHSSQGGT